MNRCRLCGAAITWVRDIAGTRFTIDPFAREEGELARAGRTDRGDMVVEMARPGRPHRDPFRFSAHALTCPGRRMPAPDPLEALLRQTAQEPPQEPPPPPDPPGGVREPRRPTPVAPAGAVAEPVPANR